MQQPTGTAQPPQQSVPQPPAFQFSHPSSTSYLNGAIYGDYGVGKTTWAATADDVPEMRDVLFVSAEAGERAIAFRKDLTVVRITSYTQLAKLYEWLVRHCRYRDEGDLEKLAKLESLITGVVPTRPKMFRTFILDSLTEVQKYLMYQLLGVQIGHQRLDLPSDSPEFKEWNQSSEMIQLLIRSIRDLPLNSIFVVSQQEVEDERKRQLKRLNLPGKLATNVQGFMDFVAYLAKTPPDGDGVVHRRLYLTPGANGVWQAKHRFAGTKVEYIDEPTMGKLLELDKEPETHASTDAAGTGSPEPRTVAPANRPSPRQPIRTGNGARGPIRPGR